MFKLFCSDVSLSFLCRKSKTNVNKMVESVIDSEDNDSNGKENVSSNDADDVFLKWFTHFACAVSTFHISLTCISS